MLSLTPQAEAGRPDALRPERFWNQSWNRIWYIIAYDVPESKRIYRNALRGFLRRMRMGRLQGSVWVTPFDIRPEYADLAEAGGVDSYAFLFEARTVLGRDSSAVVHEAWDFDRLGKFHRHYREVFARNLDLLFENNDSHESLLELARAELDAYLSVMQSDPLLPQKLWPQDYLGESVYQLHRRISREIRQRLH